MMPPLASTHVLRAHALVATLLAGCPAADDAAKDDECAPEEPAQACAGSGPITLWARGTCHSARRCPGSTKEDEVEWNQIPYPYDGVTEERSLRDDPDCSADGG